MENDNDKSDAPRNAKAVINREKPQRTVKISWEEPDIDERPLYYEIEAIPEFGKHKLKTCEDTAMIFTCLKTKTRYEFQIFAVYEDSKSEGCMTNSVETHAKPSQISSVQYSHMKGSSVDNRNAVINSSTSVNNLLPDEYDKPTNVKMNMRSEKGAEMAWISWDPPRFFGQYDDYEIIQYDVEVKECDVPKLEEIYKPDNAKTDRFVIELGTQYNLHIHTTYEEIDTEKEQISDFQKIFFSRPAHPIIEITEEKEQVHLSWHSALGAERYKLKVIEKSSGQHVKLHDGGQNFTGHTLQINNQQLCRGKYYEVEVVAFRENDKSTSSKIERLIGGEMVPKLVEAKLNKDNPLTSVDIHWVPPNKTPLNYKVCVVGGSTLCQEVNETSCTFRCLKMGSKYQFSVASVYPDGTESDGCFTDEITTDPKPSTHVPRLDVKVSEDQPHSSISAYWGKVTNAINYKVIAKHDDYLQEVVTEGCACTILGLSSNTEYHISVLVGTDEGFGAPTTETCKTDLETPHNVKLCSKSSDSVTLDFDPVEGIADFIATLHDAENERQVAKEHLKENFHTFKKLHSNKKYYAVVRSKKGNIQSSKRKSAEILTAPAVKKIKLSHSENNLSSDIKLEWEKGGGDIHEIEIKTDKEVEQILKIENKNSCFYRCLKPGNNYTARLRVKNEAGCSKWSKPKVLQLVKPLPPKYVEIKFDKVTPWCVADITWDRPETVESFKVQIYDGDKMFHEFTHDNSYKFMNGNPSRRYEVQIFSQDSSGVLSEEAITKFV